MTAAVERTKPAKIWLTPEMGLVLGPGGRTDLVFPRGPLIITQFVLAPSDEMALVAESLSIEDCEQLALAGAVPLAWLAQGRLDLSTIREHGPLSFLRVHNTSREPVRFMLRALGVEPE